MTLNRTLDYCDSLFSGITDSLLGSVQSVQNADTCICSMVAFYEVLYMYLHIMRRILTLIL